ncbi:unnamed protein product [Rotaria magnacalcarata]|uniref:DDE Tnp4 domain-containing protein n=1 Tax=Rotaria magnacalcarata TaxID=392030 RepID=A0A816ZPK0_9BILA|nr:unnamed protein product [Rotaria magnacalcarata]
MPTDCFICNTCRWMYNKWEANLGLNQILLQIDMLSQDDDGMTEEKDESSNENASGDVGTDSNDNSDDEMINDEESDENSSNDSKAKSNHKYDNEMIDDEESNGSSPSDSEMDCNDVYDNASVTDKSSFTSKDGLKLPTGISISSKRIQMVPPTVTINKEDRSNIFIRRNTFIPKGSRCCKIHTSNGYLLREDFFKLTAYKDDYRIFNLNYIVNTMQKLRKMVNSNKNVDFDDPLSLSDIEYKNLTGFTRTQHDHVLSYIPASALKTSINRSPRCAIACLLMKLRLGVSNSVLASMLGIDNKRKVTDIIHSTSAALIKYFVPHYLGLAHINREEIIKKHTSSIATRLLTENRNPCILVLDGTYLYIQVQLSFYICFATSIFSFHEQKSRNNQMQRKTFNLHKNRSLIKPMVAVTTTGYIVSVLSPFFSDNSNNDASILKHIMINNYDDILQWVEENDIMVLDRGFRDSLGVLKS